MCDDYPINHITDDLPKTSVFLRSTPASWNLNIPQQSWVPPTDVYETADHVIVRVEIAGMASSDFEINFEHNLLSIRGVRADIAERRAFHQMEIQFGEFQINIHIPLPVIHTNIEGEYRDGFLWIDLPKAMPKIISIKSDLA